MFQIGLFLFQIRIFDLKFINGCISHAALGCNFCLCLSQFVPGIGQLNIHLLEIAQIQKLSNLHLFQL